MNYLDELKKIENSQKITFEIPYNKNFDTRVQEILEDAFNKGIEFESVTVYEKSRKIILNGVRSGKVIDFHRKGDK